MRANREGEREEKGVPRGRVSHAGKTILDVLPSKRRQYVVLAADGGADCAVPVPPSVLLAPAGSLEGEEVLFRDSNVCPSGPLLPPPDMPRDGLREPARDTDRDVAFDCAPLPDLPPIPDLCEFGPEVVPTFATDSPSLAGFGHLMPAGSSLYLIAPIHCRGSTMMSVNGTARFMPAAAYSCRQSSSAYL